MNNTSLISNDKVNNYLLKIAKEYNIGDESSNGKNQINSVQSVPSQPLISTGCFSTLFSNNQINMHSNQESEKNGKKKSPNSLLILIGAVTAIAAGFGLGRLQSSIVEAEDNILEARYIKENRITWNQNRDSGNIQGVLEVADEHQRVEMARKSKLSDYQLSLIGAVLGIGIGVVGAAVSIELLAIIGIITVVASATFATYQVAIHWNDFTRAQDKFKELRPLDLIVDLPKTTPFPQTSAPFQPPHCTSAPSSAPKWDPFVFATPSAP